MQIECVYARVSLNARNNSDYNIPYFMSKQPASRTFLPSPVHFSRGKLGYLVARIAAASTLTAHTNALEVNLLEILLHLHLPFLFSSRSRRRSWLSLLSPFPLPFTFPFFVLLSCRLGVTSGMKINKRTLFLI